jgi:hypothetical protein
MTTKRRFALLLLSATAAACGSGSDGAPPDVGSDTLLAITVKDIAGTVNCARVIVGSTSTLFDNLNVIGKRAFTSISVPPGTAVVSVQGFGVACAEVPGASSADGGSSADASAHPADAGVPPIVIAAGGPDTVVVPSGATTTATLDLAPLTTQGTTPAFEAPQCLLAGSACKVGGAVCCTGHCGVDFGGASSSCRAIEPPGAVTATLPPNRKADEFFVRGGRMSYPAFDGDAFFATFPRVPRDPVPTSTGDVRTQFVVPALAAIGADPGRVTALLSPQMQRQLPGGDFGALLRSLCTDGDTTADNRVVCAELLGMPPPTALVNERLGMTRDQMKTEIERQVFYWVFHQRERGVLIEHKPVVAVQRAGQAVTSVFGAFLSKYRIVNEVGLNEATASETGRALLATVTGQASLVSSKDDPTALVLLPYGTAPEDATVTALRFAYRITARGKSGQTSDPPGYAVWIDAAEGDLLKYVGASAADGDAGAAVGDAGAAPSTTMRGRIWCRDPVNMGTCQPMAAVETQGQGIDAFARNVQFDMENGALGPWKLPCPLTSCPPTSLPAAPNVCGDGNAQGRAGNLFFSLNRSLGVVRNAGRFTTFGPPIAVTMDANQDQNTASFDRLSLTFAAGSSLACGNPSMEKLPGATDGTIINHELAHLVTMQLQSMDATHRCDAADCPFTNPYNRAFFHDYADGYAAILSGSPCIGGWQEKNKSTIGSSSQADQIAAACGHHSAGSDLPRLLFSDQSAENVFTESAAFAMQVQMDDKAASQFASNSADVNRRNARQDWFPIRRRASPEPYGDGQIVGAALWHLREGMFSLSQDVGIGSLLGHLNQAIWSTGFSPTVCLADTPECDANVYRSGRELLLHLVDNWMASEGRQSTNKVLSAFARAGIFLAPVGCLNGKLLAVDASNDDQYCGTGKTGGDAIIDIDFDRTVNTTSIKSMGIFQRQDDVISVSAAPPRLRIWTGPRVVFNSAGGAASVSPDLCNDQYYVQYRVSPFGSTPEQRQAMGWTTLPDAATGSLAPVPANDCAGTALFPAAVWDAMKPATKARPEGVPQIVEYRAVTSRRGFPALGERYSDQPGNGQWTNQAGAQPAVFNRPSAFFVTP